MVDWSHCRLSDFEDFERLGRRTSPKIGENQFYGCYGVVYKARLRVNSQFYALKICLNVDAIDVLSDDLKRQFEDEFRCRERLPEHPNVVRILSVFTDHTVKTKLPDWDKDVLDHSVVIVMEYLPMTLAQVIARRRAQRSPFSSVEVLTIAVALLGGVTHLMENKFVHRDLKSDNILLSADGSILRIADFGRSLDCKHMDGFKVLFNNPSVVLGGARACLAPEVRSARPGPGVTIDYAKNDVFAVGMILYKMLSADWPYPASDFSQYHPPRSVCSDTVRALIEGLLVADCAQRWGAREAYDRATAALEEEEEQRWAEPAHELEEHDELIELEENAEFIELEEQPGGRPPPPGGPPWGALSVGWAATVSTVFWGFVPAQTVAAVAGPTAALVVGHVGPLAVCLGPLALAVVPLAGTAVYFVAKRAKL